jgi:flagellar basal body-associated protein FliL
MFDPAQILLIVIIVILTIFLVVLGIQVFLILKDLRKTIEKANKVLDDTGEITQSVAAPISSLSGAIMGIKTGATFANMLKKVTEIEKEEEKVGK